MILTQVKRFSVKIQLVWGILAAASAVLLPQIFHAVGVVSGTGPLLGKVFLPMHIPVILAGLIFGSFAGVVAGVLSPVLSFIITGMPDSALLPFIVVELVCYGLAAGLLVKTKLPVFAKLVIIQLAGRALRIISVLIALYGFGSQLNAVSVLKEMFVVSLPGILLQWAVIPLIIYRINGIKTKNG